MEHWVFWGCFGFSRGILSIFVRVPGCSGFSRRCSGVFRGVPGFLEGVPGCSRFSRRCSGVFRVFHTVPGVPGCSGMFRCSVFRCSGVPGITTCRKFGRFEESTKLFSEGFWMK